MFNIVLVHPEIPPNAGNVIRLAANTGARLHLVEPLGFSLDNSQLKRAGLDYRDLAHVEVHRSFELLKKSLAGRRMYAFSARGTHNYADTGYRLGDVLVFGSETNGLPAALLAEFSDERRLRLPMLEGNRSLNLSNAVAIVVYEAWRQLGFLGAS